MMFQTRTERLTLRAFQSADAPAIVGMLDDPEMSQWLALVPSPYTLSDAQMFVDGSAEDALAVCTHDGNLVGAVGLGAQLGYRIGKAYWGCGYAFEASQAVLADYFAKDGADVTSGYAKDNRASGAVLRRLGFFISHERMLHIRSRDLEVPSYAVVLSKSRWDALT